MAETTWKTGGATIQCNWTALDTVERKEPKIYVWSTYFLVVSRTFIKSLPLPHPHLSTLSFHVIRLAIWSKGYRPVSPITGCFNFSHSCLTTSKSRAAGGANFVPWCLQKAFQPTLLIVLFYVLLVCKCVLYYWHRVSTQLQLTNISISFQYKYCTFTLYTRAVAQWLRCCATNRKVAGSIPAGVSGFFIDIKSFW